MARPVKSGLLYFPFDVDFFSDRKVKALRARFGSDGILFYQYILCEIYRDEGYFLKIDEYFGDSAAADLGVSCEKIGLMLNFLTNQSMLLDGTLFVRDKVLTSHGIQSRYQLAKKKMGQKTPILIDERFWILDNQETETFIKVRQKDDKSEFTPHYSEFTPSFSVNNSTNKSKVNKSKVKHIAASVFPEEITTEVTQIIALYNSICTELPKALEIIHAKRERAIAELLANYTKEDFEAVFKKANANNFLCGGGKSGWTANIDWILKPDKFIQILEGAYDKAEGTTGHEPTSYDINELDRFWDNVPTLV